MKDSIINSLNSIENIFEFFKESGYNIEDDFDSFPVSDLIEKDIEGEAWTIIDQTNLTVLVIKSSRYNRKSYRNKIDNNLTQYYI